MTLLPLVTAKECEASAPDVVYELRAMVQARDFSTHIRQNTDPTYADPITVMRNCAIESFLLHYRALREFFSSHPKIKADNLKATDYLATWQTSAVWVTNQTEIDRLHKRLAHLSTLRTTLDNDWDLAYMESGVSRTFEDFISKLTPVEQTWFQDATDLINQRRPAAPVVLGADSNSTASGGPPTMTFPFHWK
jgi:hypothetical protein